MGFGSCEWTMGDENLGGGRKVKGNLAYMDIYRLGEWFVVGGGYYEASL